MNLHILEFILPGIAYLTLFFLAHKKAYIDFQKKKLPGLIKSYVVVLVLSLLIPILALTLRPYFCTINHNGEMGAQAALGVSVLGILFLAYSVRVCYLSVMLYFSNLK